MGRLWLGIGLMMALLALGLWTASAMAELHGPISQTLEEAAAQSLSGDLEGGVMLARKAKARWEENWRRTAAVSDHTPMDEIDGLFAQVESYAAAGQALEFAAHCARLAQRIEAVGDAHKFTWWNLLSSCRWPDQ